MEALKKIIRTIPKSQIRPQVKAIKESLILCDSISAQIQHSSFLELLGSSDYLVLYETLASIKQLLSNLSQDPVDNRSLIVNIIDSMHGFLAALRRIWKLPRDVKINQTLDIYIQKKISCISTKTDLSYLFTKYITPHKGDRQSAFRHQKTLHLNPNVL